MEADNQVEMSDSVVVLPDQQAIAFDEIGDSQAELAWKLKTNCTTKEVEEEKSLRIYCCKAHYLGNSEQHDSGLTDVIKVCPAKPLLTRKVSDMLSCVYRDEEDMILGCQTPRESIFDPFAPGPEVLVCAPMKKMFKEIKVPIRRKLNFDMVDDSAKIVKADVVDDAAEEDCLFDFIFESFLDLIVSNQLKELSANKLPMQDHGLEGPKTPTSLPLLTGVSETCPPAPMRLPAKSKSYVSGSCRKLDFGQT